MKVLVCGGRDFSNTDMLWDALDLLFSTEIVEMVIQGGAKGADSMAEEWASYNKVPCLNVPADWEKYGKRAGFLRNALMLTFKPDVVLALPGGKGTDMMCSIAEKKGITVIKYEARDATDHQNS